ncbi:NAD(P)/FAD-dependent oxidoreductase [Glutamicibacter creatinolyticus]
MEHFDVVVIGGGAAGLAAASTLARSLRSVLVCDAGEPRNATSAAAHNILGHDGASPQQVLQLARDQAISYGVKLSGSAVTGLEGSLNQGFTVRTDSEHFGARRIVLATGLRDTLPKIPGLGQGWGKSVLHCPYCHGWEVRGQRIAILGVSAMSSHQAQLFSQLSKHVTYVNHDPSALAEDQRTLLEALGIEIVNSAVQALDVHDDGSLHGIKLSNGVVLDADAAVVASSMHANAGLYLSLGGQLAQHPMGEYIATDQMGTTDIPGVYAAGNVANLGAMILASAAAGVTAGAAANADLLQEAAKKVMLGRKTKSPASS